jgi:hypothetical protein
VKHDGEHTVDPRARLAAIRIVASLATPPGSPGPALNASPGAS